MSERMRFSKELFSKHVLMKTAYEFIDTFYIHLDCDNDFFYVEMDRKDKSACPINRAEFENTLLIHQTREIVHEKTGHLREIMYARAMASTIIEEYPKEDAENTEEYDKEDLIRDWFD